MPWRMQITPLKYTRTNPPSPTRPELKQTQMWRLKRADVWWQYAPGGPWPQLQLLLRFQLEQMSPISPAPILSSHISAVTPAPARQTSDSAAEESDPQRVCERGLRGEESTPAGSFSTICTIIGATLSYICTGYTRRQHVNTESHTGRSILTRPLSSNLTLSLTDNLLLSNKVTPPWNGKLTAAASYSPIQPLWLIMNRQD